MGQRTSSLALGLLAGAVLLVHSGCMTPDQISATQKDVSDMRQQMEALRKENGETAAKVVTAPPPVKPYKVGKKVTLEIRLRPGLYLEAVRKRLAAQMSGKNTLVVRGASATDVWARYWADKIRCQALAAGKGSA